MLDCSFKKIGEEFGGKDHSTVIASIAKVEKMLKENSDYLIAINEIKEIIKKH
jgi:chromosomal replication initiator protein